MSVVLSQNYFRSLLPSSLSRATLVSVSGIRYTKGFSRLHSHVFDPRFSLPGFNLPLNFKPHAKSWKHPEPSGEGKDLFRNALDAEDVGRGYVSLRLTPLRELTMLHIMNKITDKPDWHIKVFDEEIVKKWRKEILATKGQGVTDKMVNWVIAELRFRTKGFKKTGFFSVFDADVVKSDTAIPPEVKQALRGAVSALENVPDHLKDWHPGSDGKVLDLVHPSLFPLVYGRSRILENGTTTLEDFVQRTGQGSVLPIPPKDQTEWSTYSRDFQWLPCDVELLDNGKDVKITSYINNLHPSNHRKLYGVIEQILARTIPLWNQTLTSMMNIHRRIGWERIRYDRVQYDPDPENGPEEDGPQQEGPDDEEYWYRREKWYQETRKVVLPEPDEFRPPTIPERIVEHVRDVQYDEDGLLRGDGTVDIFRDYRHRGLQVIVKLANIHLTPEKPEYDGGSWHVEGQMNEHICASAVYYYDSENITASYLSFRQQVCGDAAQDVSYPQDHHDWLEAVFGCKQDGPTVQELGSVATSEDRLLTWPNILQHQVKPFRLADATKPGHKKILALFLVDPHIRIISTANIPCQRKDWWEAHVKKLAGSVAELPLQLQGQVSEDVDFPFTMEDAKELRLKLMEERSKYAHGVNEDFHQDRFNLCEH